MAVLLQSRRFLLAETRSESHHCRRRFPAYFKHGRVRAVDEDRSMMTAPEVVGGVAEHDGGRTRFVAMFEIIEWLAGDECHELDDAGLAEGLGRHLRAAELPLDRLTLHLRTLDPEILSRTIAWAPDEPAEIHDRKHGIELLAGFGDSPVRRVIET
jgi:hypothetical protein